MQPDNPEPDMRVELARLYIATHFKENIRLSSIARQAGLSKHHFHRLFSRSFGYTPQVYLEKTRLEYAAHFIVVHDHLPMTEVSFECGFSSPAVFSRAFKKYYSTSPSAYRRKYALSDPVEKPQGRASVSIQYLASKTVHVQKVKLQDPWLSDALSGMANAASCAIGFFLDVPSHVPLEDCRYYAGAECTGRSGKGSSASVLTMPAGYYVSARVSGSFEEFNLTLYDLREKIYGAGYRIDSLIGYERIPLDNPGTFRYFETERELFIKVCRI